MIKVHYDPFLSSIVHEEDYPEFGGCGTLLQEDCENVTSDKEDVTCKKCINRFDSLTTEFEAAKKAELDFMNGFVKFQEKKKHRERIGTFKMQNGGLVFHLFERI